MPRATLKKYIYKAPTIRSGNQGKDRHAPAFVQTQRVRKLQDTQSDEYTKVERGPKRLYLHYVALQRRHGKWVGSYQRDKRMRTCFRKLSKKLDELKAIGLEVDEVDYICAHKATYGDALRPNHLISWCSLAIYQSYLTEKNAEQIDVSPEEQAAYDTAMVDYLMQVRGESKADVVKLLESFDLL
jgi:hypothetical protein